MRGLSQQIAVRKVALICFALFFLMLVQHTDSLAAVRHRSYVGTITTISFPINKKPGSVTIRSKTHNTTYHFVIDSTTAFLKGGKGEPRTSFKVGSYVTISYNLGAHGTMVAYHISLRQSR